MLDPPRPADEASRLAALRALMEALPDALLIFDPTGRIEWLSPSAERLFGYREAELSGEEVGVLIADPAQRARIESRLRRAAARPERVVTRLSHQVLAGRRDGSSFLAELAVSELRVGDRRRFVTVVRDVSERKRAEAVRGRLAAIVEGSDDAIIGMALDGQITDWNSAAQRLYGYSPAEIVDRSIALLLPPERSSDLQRILTRVRRGEQVAAFETVRLHRDGRRLEVSVSVAPIRDPAGQIIGAASIVRDIAERRRLEAALQRSLARGERLLELARHLSAEGGARRVFEQALATAVALVDGQDASIARWDEARGELIRVASFQPAASGDVLLDLERTASGRAARQRAAVIVNDYQRQVGDRSPAGQAGARALLAVPFLHEGRLVGTLAVSTRDRHKRFTRADAEALELLAGVVAAALATAEAIEHERRAVQELERLNKVKSDFVSIVSHEFRTPLTGIQGFSEIIRDEQLDPDEVREFADDINKDARRLARLIDDMLDLDRMESGKMKLRLEPLDLNGLVREVADQAAPTAPGHQLRLDLDERLPLLRGDRDKLTQVVTNLLSNAVKYSPGGGEIVVATGLQAPAVELCVQDRGLGIPPEALETIFERYARIESGAGHRIQGTGLGLPIVRQIAELHGGRAWAESEVGQGSTFYLRLPLAGPPTGGPADG